MATIISPVKIDERKVLNMRPGDTVRIHQKIKDGEKSRIQVFEGLVIARKHGTEAGATFTVRKISAGIGVERIFPLYSPNIEKIEVVRRSKTRRAKLYYVRDKAAKELRKRQKQIAFTAAKMAPEPEAASEAVEAAEPVAVEAVQE